MSRSTKKPIYTDQQKNRPWKHHKPKREANKTIRRAEDVPSGKAYKKEYCSWNIRDWSFYCPKDKKAYRK